MEAETRSRTLIAGLDIETTGIDQADGHRIIEVAIAIHELESQARVGSFVSRINPQRPIDPGAQEVHKISFDMLAHEPLWGAVAPKVSAILSRCQYVVAHNGEGFDLPFVCAELQREGCTVPRQFKLIDTMLQARWATPDGSVPNLGALCFACGVDYDTSKAHGALYDVDVMMACFFSQHKRGFFTLPEHEYQFKAPLSRKKERK
jgi:DNA polymerase-3 subunit epsilon